MTRFYAQQYYLSEHAGRSNWAAEPLGSPEAMHQLLESLQQTQPTERRQAAIDALTKAPPPVVPILIDALTASDPGIRRGAAEILGSLGAPEAEDPLFFATYDTDPGVRATALWALGEIGTPFVLPRLTWVQVTDTNADVRQAARQAEDKVYANVAAALGVPSSELRAVSVATSNGRVFAATSSDLYAPRGSDWGRVGRLPGVPTALAATGHDGRVVYLGTAAWGVFRSVDGGATWQPINAGLATTSRFAVTALTTSPDDPRHVFVTLATAPGATQTPLTPFGIFRSVDGGDTWVPLIQWNVDQATKRLVVDPAAPGQLFGLTENGVWRYPLDLSGPDR